MQSSAPRNKTPEHELLPRHTRKKPPLLSDRG